jgi:hypothetical protein
MAVARQEIPALPHTFAAAEWIWAEDCTEAAVSLFCQTCGHSETAAAEITTEETTAPTLTACGRQTHTAVAVVGEDRWMDVRCSVVPALGPALAAGVELSRDPITGAVTAENMPEAIVIVLAVYDNGRMRSAQLLGENTVIALSEGDSLRAFFLLAEGYVPVAAYRDIVS